jgi:SAM-dependent methyltransferase
MASVVAEFSERPAAAERYFPLAVAFGGRSASLASALLSTKRVGTVHRLEQVEGAFSGNEAGGVADEEALPLGRGSVDLYLSALTLQWANDLPGALIQIRQALKPGGWFLGAATGGRTLHELREALFAAEIESRGGASPRVLPAADLADYGALMQRAGFVQPVADRDVLTVRYDSARSLAADLRAMGAGNALAERDRRPIGRSVLSRVAEIYAERFSDPDGRVRATFEIITLSGWAPQRSGGAAQRASPLRAPR